MALKRLLARQLWRIVIVFLAGQAVQGALNVPAPLRPTVYAGYNPLPAYAPTATSQAKVYKQSVATLSGGSLRCVDFAVLAACGPANVTGNGCANEAFGDGFSRLKKDANGNPTARAAQIMNLPDNGTVAVGLSELDGANVWLLRNLTSVGNVTVAVDILRLPAALRGGPDRARQLDYVFNVLRPGYYDCALPSTTVSPDRALYVQFLQPHQPFGFLVVSPVPEAAARPTGERLWAWVKPFSGPVWLTMVATCIAVGAAMAFFEASKNERDFKTVHEHGWRRRIHQAWHGSYTALSHFFGSGFFLSVTIPGRILNVSFSFFSKLLLATYTASLSSALISGKKPPRLVTSMDSFQETGLPACILNRPEHVAFVAANYPRVQLYVVDSTDSVTALLSSLQQGLCGGAIGINVDLQYSLGLGDVAGDFCELDYAGGTIGSGAFALPFNLRVPPSVISALSNLGSVVINDNTYYQTAMNIQFGKARPGCGAGVFAGGSASSASSPPKLEITDMAGVFIILCMGLAGALSIQAWLSLRAARAREALKVIRRSGEKLIWKLGSGTPPVVSPTSPHASLRMTKSVKKSKSKRGGSESERLMAAAAAVAAAAAEETEAEAVAAMEALIAAQEEQTRLLRRMAAREGVLSGSGDEEEIIINEQEEEDEDRRTTRGR